MAHASSEPVRAKLQERIIAARQLMGQMFAAAQQRGEVRSDISPDHLGWLVHLIFFGMTLAWTMNPEKSLTETVSAAWEIVSTGLAPKAQPLKET